MKVSIRLSAVDKVSLRAPKTFFSRFAPHKKTKSCFRRKIFSKFSHTLQVQYGSGHICSGVLITNFSILTAATCLLKTNDGNEFFAADELVVAMGTEDKEEQSVRILYAKVIAVKTHSRFNKRTLANNLALLKVILLTNKRLKVLKLLLKGWRYRVWTDQTYYSQDDIEGEDFWWWNLFCFWMGGWREFQLKIIIKCLLKIVWHSFFRKVNQLVIWWNQTWQLQTALIVINKKHFHSRRFVLRKFLIQYLIHALVKLVLVLFAIMNFVESCPKHVPEMMN